MTRDQEEIRQKQVYMEGLRVMELEYASALKAKDERYAAELVLKDEENVAELQHKDQLHSEALSLKDAELADLGKRLTAAECKADGHKLDIEMFKDMIIQADKELDKAKLDNVSFYFLFILDIGTNES